MIQSCPLCNNIRELPADNLVWQFPYSVALLGPWQYYTGYCVLISRVHFAELHQMPAADRGKFLEEMVMLERAIAETFQPRKMNCESLGNQVPHLHWHLFPRSMEDPETLKPVWIALARADQDDSERRRLQTSSLSKVEIITRLRSALTQLQAPTP